MNSREYARNVWTLFLLNLRIKKTSLRFKLDYMWEGVWRLRQSSSTHEFWKRQFHLICDCSALRLFEGENQNTTNSRQSLNWIRCTWRSYNSIKIKPNRTVTVKGSWTCKIKRFTTTFSLGNTCQLIPTSLRSLQKSIKLSVTNFKLNKEHRRIKVGNLNPFQHWLEFHCWHIKFVHYHRRHIEMKLSVGKHSIDLFSLNKAGMTFDLSTADLVNLFSILANKTNKIMS